MKLKFLENIATLRFHFPTTNTAAAADDTGEEEDWIDLPAAATAAVDDTGEEEDGNILAPAAAVNDEGEEEDGNILTPAAALAAHAAAWIDLAPQ